MSIRWAVIGTGRVSNVMVPAMQAVRGTLVAAIVSRSQARADAFAAAHGIEASYGSVEEMLRSPTVDAVYIGSPNGLHAPHAMAAAAAGKHVLCEKPMAPTVSDCHRMIEACQKHGVKLGIGFQYRQYPAQQKAREMVARGDLGRVLFADIKVEVPTHEIPEWYSDPEMAGGGVTSLAGVHRIDLLRYLTGAEVQEVCAFIRKTPGSQFEEAVVAILGFANGAHGTLHFGLHIPHGTNRVEVHGSAGSLSADTNSPWWGDYNPELLVHHAGGTTRHEFPKIDAYQSQIESFNRCLTEGGEPLATGMDGLRAARISLALFESDRLGKAVEVGA
jgi:1,5-anhydro-D-fructose reductase (1,5-anhydro-D-mannitol-forming)